MKMIKQLVCALALTLLWGGAAWAEDIVVAVNARAPVDSLTVGQVRDIYTGETTLWGNTPIQAIGYRDSEPLQVLFLDRVVGTSLKDYNMYWMRRVFQEGGIRPVKAESTGDALDRVAASRGGIGFFRPGDVSGVSGIKVVLRISR